MTENTHNHTVTTESNAEPNATNTNNVREKLPLQTTKSPALIYLALTLSTLAAAAGGVALYQQQNQTITSQLLKLQQQQTQLAEQIETQVSKTTVLTHVQTQLKNQSDIIQSLQTELKLSQALAERQKDDIASLTQQLNRLKNTTKEDWKLAEAEYLIRLANQRLLMEDDLEGAQNLLISADQILANIADPILFDTRKAIAKDIQSLKATPDYDIEGLFLQLQALQDQVESLPQKEPSKTWQKATSETTRIPLETGASLQTFTADLWQSLRALIVINYQQKPIKALLPAADYQELVSHLKLQLNIAQLALMKKESTVYHSSLKSVAQLTSQFFDLQAQPVIAFITAITALQQVNPAPERPLPRQSLLQMKHLMSQWQAQPRPTVSTPPAESAPTTDALTLSPTPDTQPSVAVPPINAEESL